MDECRTLIDALSGNLDELVGEMDKMLEYEAGSFFMITCLHTSFSPFVIFFDCYCCASPAQSVNY